MIALLLCNLTCLPRQWQGREILSHGIFLGDFGILVSSKVNYLELIAFGPKAEGSTTVLRSFPPRIARWTHNGPEANIQRWFHLRSKVFPRLQSLCGNQGPENFILSAWILRRRTRKSIQNVEKSGILPSIPDPLPAISSVISMRPP